MLSIPNSSFQLNETLLEETFTSFEIGNDKEEENHQSKALFNNKDQFLSFINDDNDSIVHYDKMIKVQEKNFNNLDIIHNGDEQSKIQNLYRSNIDMIKQISMIQNPLYHLIQSDKFIDKGDNTIFKEINLILDFPENIDQTMKIQNHQNEGIEIKRYEIEIMKSKLSEIVHNTFNKDIDEIQQIPKIQNFINRLEGLFSKIKKLRNDYEAPMVNLDEKIALIMKIHENNDNKRSCFSLSRKTESIIKILQLMEIEQKLQESNVDENTKIKMFNKVNCLKNHLERNLFSIM